METFFQLVLHNPPQRREENCMTCRKSVCTGGYVMLTVDLNFVSYQSFFLSFLVLLSPEKMCKNKMPDYASVEVSTSQHPLISCLHVKIYNSIFCYLTNLQICFALYKPCAISMERIKT